MSVNFDNAATTFPKPFSVRRTLVNAINLYGGNAGRGGHVLANRTSEMVYNVREKVASFFDAKTENTIFCLNCTHALNTAIQGIVNKGDHVVISSVEHNSVFRPVVALAESGKIKYSIAQVYPDKEQTLSEFKKCIRPETKAIICTIASNVTGQIMPYKEIASLCKENNICMIADGAQACGVLPVKLSDGINILCTAGHKGLYGITGTGILITDGKYPIRPLMQGGTGSVSAQPSQPDFLPDSLESGTQGIIGISTIKAGIEFIEEKTLDRIYIEETRLCNQFIKSLSEENEVIIYRNDICEYVPIVSFNIAGIEPETVAEELNKDGFCLRAGLHCAPLAHQTLGTLSGTVRFAPSVFNNSREVLQLSNSIKKCVRKLKS